MAAAASTPAPTVTGATPSASTPQTPPSAPPMTYGPSDTLVWEASGAPGTPQSMWVGTTNPVPLSSITPGTILPQPDGRFRVAGMGGDNAFPTQAAAQASWTSSQTALGKMTLDGVPITPGMTTYNGYSTQAASDAATARGVVTTGGGTGSAMVGSPLYGGQETTGIAGSTVPDSGGGQGNMGQVTTPTASQPLTGPYTPMGWQQMTGSSGSAAASQLGQGLQKQSMSSLQGLSY